MAEETLPRLLITRVSSTAEMPLEGDPVKSFGQGPDLMDSSHWRFLVLAHPPIELGPSGEAAKQRAGMRGTADHDTTSLSLAHSLSGGRAGLKARPSVTLTLCIRHLAPYRVRPAQASTS